MRDGPGARGKRRGAGTLEGRCNNGFDDADMAVVAGDEVDHLAPLGGLCLVCRRRGDDHLDAGERARLDQRAGDVVAVADVGQPQPVQPAEVAANLAHNRSDYPSLVAHVVEEASVQAPVHDEPHFPIYTDDLAPVERLVDSIIYRFATTSGR